jgi:energy-converting hydrogenase B subunit D
VTELQVLFVIVPILIVVCAIMVARFHDLIHAVIALAVLSLLMSLLFYLLHAPDVAIAEAGIGAAITTAVYVVAIRATKGRKSHDT